MVYEWLSETRPFSEGDFIQSGYQHAHEPVPPLCDKAPSISAEVEAVVMREMEVSLSQAYCSTPTDATPKGCPIYRAPFGCRVRWAIYCPNRRQPLKRESLKALLTHP